MKIKLFIKIISLSVLTFSFLFLLSSPKVALAADDCTDFCHNCGGGQATCDGSWGEDTGWINCDEACQAGGGSEGDCCTWGPNGNWSCHCNGGPGGDDDDDTTPPPPSCSFSWDIQTVGYNGDGTANLSVTIAYSSLPNYCYRSMYHEAELLDTKPGANCTTNPDVSPYIYTCQALNIPAGVHTFRFEVGDTAYGQAFPPGCSATRDFDCGSTTYTVVVPMGTILGRVVNQANNAYLKSSAVCTTGTVLPGLAINFGSGITTNVDQCNPDPYYIKSLIAGTNHTVSAVIPVGWEAVSWICSSPGGTSCPAATGLGGTVNNVPLKANEAAHIWFYISPIPEKPACAYGPELLIDPYLTNIPSGKWGFWNSGNASYSFASGDVAKLISTGNGSGGLQQQISGLAGKRIFIKAALKRKSGGSASNPYTGFGIRYTTGVWEYNYPSGIVYYPSSSDSWEIVGNSTSTLIPSNVDRVQPGASIWAANAGNYYIGWVSICEDPPPPTCTISGPTTIYAGDTATYTANTTVGDSGGDANTEIGRSSSLALGTRIGYTSCGNLNSTCSLTQNIVTTAAEADTSFNVYCRGWNDSLRECRPFSPYVYPYDTDCKEETHKNVCDTNSGSTDCLKVNVLNPNGTIEGMVVDENAGVLLKSSAVCGTRGTVLPGLSIGFGSGITANVDQCSADPYYTKTLLANSYNVTVNVPVGWEALTWGCTSVTVAADGYTAQGGSSCPPCSSPGVTGCGNDWSHGDGGTAYNVPLKRSELAEIWFWIQPIPPSCRISGSMNVTAGESGLWSATTTVGSLSGYWEPADTAITRNTIMSKTGWFTLNLDGNGYPALGRGSENGECVDPNSNLCNIKRRWITTSADIGTHYLSCRGWNDNLVECNPFGIYDPANKLVDCDGTIDNIPVSAPIEDSCTGSGSSDCITVTVSEPKGWFQVRGGDVHAQNDVKSSIPTVMIAVSRFFNLDLPAATNLPGLISYFNDYNFSSDAADLLTNPKGISRSSTKKWLAYSSFSPQKSSFNDFVEKLKNQTMITSADCSSLPPSIKDGKTTFYRINGDCNIPSKFSVDTNSKVVILVDGGLSIDGSGTNVTVAQDGSFLSFIVQGDIVFGHNIGNKTAGYTELPAIEGIYITNGTIYTGSSLGVKNIPKSGERLIAAGSFFAKNFDLGRDLKDNGVGHANNTDTPAELFTFRPDLVVNAPYALWSSKIDWQEVAP